MVRTGEVIIRQIIHQCTCIAWGHQGWRSEGGVENIVCPSRAPGSKVVGANVAGSVISLNADIVRCGGLVRVRTDELERYYSIGNSWNDQTVLPSTIAAEFRKVASVEISIS